MAYSMKPSERDDDDAGPARKDEMGGDTDPGKITVRKPMGGVFMALARKAEMTPMAFARANLHEDSEVGKLARMYYLYNSGGVHGDGSTNMSGAGDDRSLATRIYQVG